MSDGDAVQVRSYRWVYSDPDNEEGSKLFLARLKLPPSFSRTIRAVLTVGERSLAAPFYRRNRRFLNIEAMPFVTVMLFHSNGEEVWIHPMGRDGLHRTFKLSEEEMDEAPFLRVINFDTFLVGGETYQGDVELLTPRKIIGEAVPL